MEISHVVHAVPKMRARGGRVGSFEPRPEPSGLRTDPKLQLRGSDKHGFGYVILCNFAFVSLDQLGTEQCASIYLWLFVLTVGNAFMILEMFEKVV